MHLVQTPLFIKKNSQHKALQFQTAVDQWCVLESIYVYAAIGVHARKHAMLYALLRSMLVYNTAGNVGCCWGNMQFGAA